MQLLLPLLTKVLDIGAFQINVLLTILMSNGSVSLRAKWLPESIVCLPSVKKTSDRIETVTE